MDFLLQKSMGQSFSPKFNIALALLYQRYLKYRMVYFNKWDPAPDRSNWPKSTSDMFTVLYGKYAEYCQTAIDHLEELKNSRVYIYGAGMVGEQIVKIMNLYDIAIAGILVTDPERNAKKTLMGHLIQGIDQTALSPESDVVLLAVDKKYQSEMMNILNSKKIRKVIVF